MPTITLALEPKRRYKLDSDVKHLSVFGVGAYRRFFRLLASG